MTRCATCGSESASANCESCGATSGDPLPGRGQGPIGLVLIGLVQGGETPFDGQWLRHYDPHEPGVAPDGSPMLVTVATTADHRLALRFENAMAARREWMRWDGTDRPDGQPSRPLTAFNIEITQLPG